MALHACAQAQYQQGLFSWVRYFHTQYIEIITPRKFPLCSVALSMAELACAYPTSGALYYWWWVKHAG